MPYGEEGGLGHLLVGGGSGRETEARDDARSRIDGHEQTEAFSYHAKRLDHPMSAKPASHPSPRRLASRTGITELSKAS